MPIEWQTAGDFSSIVDGLEAVTLKRRGSGKELTIPAALRSPAVVGEAEPSAGAVVASDLQWRFELPEGESPILVGDSIADDAGERWTVLSIQSSRGETRTICTARSLTIHHRLDQRVAIEQAVWEDNGSGPEVASWTLLRPSVPARIQPYETTNDPGASPPGSVTRFRIWIVDELPLNHNHRLTDGRGVAYQIDRYSGAERIDALALVEASIEQFATA